MTAAERERYQRRYGLSPKNDPTTTTETQTQREQGRIKLINTDRRFLFIAGDNGVDIFAHCSQCGDEFDVMRLTDRVEYSVGPSKKHPGMKAAYAVKLV
jgi:cold shock CspA family protein